MTKQILTAEDIKVDMVNATDLILKNVVEKLLPNIQINQYSSDELADLLRKADYTSAWGLDCGFTYIVAGKDFKEHFADMENEKIAVSYVIPESALLRAVYVQSITIKNEVARQVCALLNMKYSDDPTNPENIFTVTYMLD